MAWPPPSRSGPSCPPGSSWSPGTPGRGAAPRPVGRRQRLRAQDHPAARLAEIIRDVASGRRYVDPDIAASALTENDNPLTDRELQVLRAARTGASINEIAAQVHLAPGTVRNYLSTAMAKLGVSSRHAAAHRAWEQGWI
jgi:DNA-binding NarL/FixJ family response regulator